MSANFIIEVLYDRASIGKLELLRNWRLRLTGGRCRSIKNLKAFGHPIPGWPHW